MTTPAECIYAHYCPGRVLPHTNALPHIAVSDTVTSGEHLPKMQTRRVTRAWKRKQLSWSRLPIELQDQVIRNVLEDTLPVPDDPDSFAHFTRQLRNLASISHSFGSSNLLGPVSQIVRSLRSIAQPLMKSMQDLSAAGDQALSETRDLALDDMQALRDHILRADMLVTLGKELRFLYRHIDRCVEIIYHEMLVKRPLQVSLWLFSLLRLRLRSNAHGDDRLQCSRGSASARLRRKPSSSNI